MVSSELSSSESFVEPDLVQVFHDGVEVARIRGGTTELNSDVKKIPSVLEIYWDHRLVYRLEKNVPVVNLISPSFVNDGSVAVA